MRDLWFISDAPKRGPELFQQGALVTSKSGGPRLVAGELAQVDRELPEEATTSVGWGLGEEGRKQHDRDRDAYEDSKRRVQKHHGVISHDIVNARCEDEVHS